MKGSSLSSFFINKFVMPKSIFFFLLIQLLFIHTTEAQVNITINNRSSTARTGELISVDWKSIQSAYPSIDTANFKVVNRATKKELSWQLEKKGGDAIVNLLVQVDLPANGRLDLQLQKGKSATIPVKTYGRYVPERKDDFAWENDKIAFRMYGKELEKTPKEMAYGMDVWVKSTDRMVINERYKRGKYHEDLGDGMDYYHVGFTLGAGNIAPMIKDSIYYDGTYARYKVLDNGPLRTSFQLEYNAWNAAGMKLLATKTITLDAGTHFNKVEVVYAGDTMAALPLVVGIIKRKEQGAMLLDELNGSMAYWEPLHGADGITGVGSFLLEPAVGIKVTATQLLMQTSTTKAKPIVYYTGAAWNKAGVFTDAQGWFSHVQLAKTKIMQPLQVGIESIK
jgi:hypothetical protein